MESKSCETCLNRGQFYYCPDREQPCATYRDSQSKPAKPDKTCGSIEVTRTGEPSRTMLEGIRLVTDDCYNDGLRERVIPLWDTMLTWQKQLLREVCESQIDLLVKAGWKSPEEYNEAVGLVCGNCPLKER